MRLGVTLDVLNQKGTPALYSDTFANRPTFGFKGRIFFSTDTGEIFEDTGTAWTLIADAGAGTTGTLQQVTTNGSTTDQGITITDGGLTSNTIELPLQSYSSKSVFISGTMANNDRWKIYGYGTTIDQGEMVFQVGDNAVPFASGGERFRFNYDNESSGIAKDVLIVDYNTSLFNTKLSVGSSSGIPVGFSGTIFYAGLSAPTETHAYNIGVTGTATADSGNTNIWGVGVYGSGFTNGVTRSAGVQGDGEVTASADTGSAIGVRGYATAIHAGGLNIGMLSDATGSSTGNYGYYTNMAASSVNYANYHAGTAQSYFGGSININGSSTNDPYLQFQNAGLTKWTIGNQYADGLNNFFLNNSTGTNIFSITGDTQANFAYSLVSYGTLSTFLVGDQIRVSGGAIDASIHTYAASNLMYIGATSSTKKGFNINLSTGYIGINTINPLGQFVVSNSGAEGIELSSYSGYAEILTYNRSTNSYIPLVVAENGSNLLVGKTIDDTVNKLQVNGSVIASAFTAGGAGSGGSGTLTLRNDGGIPASISNEASSGTLIRFSGNGSGVLGSITHNGSITLYNTTSDYRLKQDFKDFNGINIINSIKTYNYEWKITKSRMYGVIAHELQEILPYMVENIKDGQEMQQVDYSKLVPILVKAIQELNEKLERNNIN